MASIVNEHLPNENPMALAFMSALTLTEDQVNEIEEEINNTGAPETGVSNWLENNRDVVQPWIDGAQNVQESWANPRENSYRKWKRRAKRKLGYRGLRRCRDGAL